MTHTNGNGAGHTWVDEVLARAGAERDSLVEEREALVGRLAEVDVDLRRVDRVVRALTGEPAKRKSKSKAKRSQAASPERLLRAAEAILALDKPEFAAREISEALGYKTAVAVAGHLSGLREMEFIAKGASRQVQGHRHPVQLWRVLDAHRVDELREAVHAAA